MSVDMNKTFFLKKEHRKPKWIVIDAKDQIVGRLATRIADVLRGKDKAYYTPHTDAGDYVIVINAKNIVLTGDKWDQKIYDRHTGWKGGYYTATAKEVHTKKPTKIIQKAVERMLPKSVLSNQIIKKLKVYAGSVHPHQAQVK